LYPIYLLIMRCTNQKLLEIFSYLSELSDRAVARKEVVNISNKFLNDDTIVDSKRPGRPIAICSRDNRLIYLITKRHSSYLLERLLSTIT